MCRPVSRATRIWPAALRPRYLLVTSTTAPPPACWKRRSSSMARSTSSRTPSTPVPSKRRSMKMCSCVNVTPRSSGLTGPRTVLTRKLLIDPDSAQLRPAAECLTERDVALDERLHPLERRDLRVQDELQRLFGNQLLNVPIDLLAILALDRRTALGEQRIQLLVLDAGARRRAGRMHRLEVVAVWIDIRRIAHHHRVVVDLQEIVDPGRLFLFHDLQLDTGMFQLRLDQLGIGGVTGVRADLDLQLEVGLASIGQQFLGLLNILLVLRLVLRIGQRPELVGGRNVRRDGTQAEQVGIDDLLAVE